MPETIKLLMYSKPMMEATLPQVMFDVTASGGEGNNDRAANLYAVLVNTGASNGCKAIISGPAILEVFARQMLPGH
ncbi:MAG: hypothetical protein R2773_03465 [Flavobacteriaceae bacterium]